MAVLVQWRAFVGPMFHQPSHPTFWDWSALTAGGSLTTPASTLSATLAAGATSMTLASATSFPAAGGAWVGPNGSGQGWEYVRWQGKTANTLTGLIREADRDHNGAHNSGAVVQMWWPLTTNDGRLSVVKQLDAAYSAVTWRLELSGVIAPQAALRHGHVIAVQTRTTVSGAWANAYVGFILSHHLTDNARREAGWTISAGCSADQANLSQTVGVRSGDLDGARNAETSGDASLAMPYKERNSGDYTAAAPDFSASAAVDGDTKTLWIAERYVGTESAATLPAYFSAGNFASALYLHTPAGMGKGYRWIEWTAASGSFGSAWIYNRSGGGGYIAGPPISVSAGDKIILAEDDELFARANPLSDAVKVYDIGSAFFDSLDLAEDAVGVYEGSGGSWSPTVAWGATARRPYNAGDSSQGQVWPGTPVTAPTAGQTIRYFYNAAAVSLKDHFRVDYVDKAGYSMSGQTDPWIVVTLPALSLKLRDAVTNSAPGAGAVLYINDEAGPSTAGLAASGVLQVGSEQIAYSAKHSYGVTVSARGANSTTAAAHDVGDAVLVVDGSVATRGLPVQSIGWKRFGGTVYPREFRIRYTNLEQPRTPGTNNYHEDWIEAAYATTNVASIYSVALSPSKRARHVLIEIDRMTVDPARPRLNEISALLDGSVYESDTWLPPGSTTGQVVRQVLLNAYIPAGAITIVGTLPAMGENATALGFGWQVASDFAEFAGLRLTVANDSKIRIEGDPFFPAASHTPAATWTRLNAAQMERTKTQSVPAKQVQLQWQTADGATTGTEVYPAHGSEHWQGATVKLGPSIYATANAAQLAAQKRWWMAWADQAWTVTLAEYAASVEPGSVQRVQWQFDASMPVTDRLLLVETVTHRVDRQVAQTVFTGRQIDKWTAS